MLSQERKVRCSHGEAAALDSLAMVTMRAILNRNRYWEVTLMQHKSLQLEIARLSWMSLITCTVLAAIYKVNLVMDQLLKTGANHRDLENNL